MNVERKAPLTPETPQPQAPQAFTSQASAPLQAPGPLPPVKPAVLPYVLDLMRLVQGDPAADPEAMSFMRADSPDARLFRQAARRVLNARAGKAAQARAKAKSDALKSMAQALLERIEADTAAAPTAAMANLALMQGLHAYSALLGHPEDLDVAGLGRAVINDIVAKSLDVNNYAKATQFVAAFPEALRPEVRTLYERHALAVRLEGARQAARQAARGAAQRATESAAPSPRASALAAAPPQRM